MKTVKIVWRVAVGLIYLLVVIGILSAAQTRFETLVLACLAEIYAAILYNFSVIGSVTDVNNSRGSACKFLQRLEAKCQTKTGRSQTKKMLCETL